MSTRGGIGRVEGDGAIVFVYQHFDSYPSGLAAELLARYHHHGGNVQRLREEAIDEHRQGWSSYPENPYPADDDEMTSECRCPTGDYTHCDALFIEWLYVLNTSGLAVYKSAPTGETITRTGNRGSYESPVYRHIFVGTLSWDAAEEVVFEMEDAGRAVHEAEWELHGKETVR